MSVAYSIRVDRFFSMESGGLANVIMRVEWTLIGTFNGITHHVPQTHYLNPPVVGGAFIPLQEVTDADIAGWIEAQCAELPALKLVVENTLRQQDALQAFTVTERGAE